MGTTLFDEQLTHLLTEIDEHRRLIAALALLVVELKGQGASINLSPDIVAHLGHCITGRARLVADRQGGAVLTIHKGQM